LWQDNGRTTRKGQPGQDIEDRTARRCQSGEVDLTDKPGQDQEDRMARNNRKDRITGAGQS
jgi:hypothetical protein